MWPWSLHVWDFIEEEPETHNVIPCQRKGVGACSQCSGPRETGVGRVVRSQYFVTLLGRQHCDEKLRSADKPRCGPARPWHVEEIPTSDDEP